MTLLESLQAAKERNAVLNAADDRIFQAITAVEEKLRVHINVRIRITLDEKRLLAFGKFSGQWRLLLETPNGQQPLASCTREDRAMVFAGGHVEKLIVDARAQLEQAIEERKQALAIASTLVEAFDSFVGGKS